MGDSPLVVGHAELRPLPITVQRESEGGTAWEACCLTWSALGATPGEAVRNLGEALRERLLVDVLDVDAAAIDALVQSDAVTSVAEYDYADCGHPQDPPTREEITRATNFITRICATCQAGLWWNVDRWRRL